MKMQPDLSSCQHPRSPYCQISLPALFYPLRWDAAGWLWAAPLCNTVLGEKKKNKKNQRVLLHPLLREAAGFWEEVSLRSTAWARGALLNCSAGRCHKQAGTWQTYRFPGAYRAATGAQLPGYFNM